MMKDILQGMIKLCVAVCLPVCLTVCMSVIFVYDIAKIVIPTKERTMLGLES